LSLATAVVHAPQEGTSKNNDSPSRRPAEEQACKQADVQEDWCLSMTMQAVSHSPEHGQ